LLYARSGLEVGVYGSPYVTPDSVCSRLCHCFVRHFILGTLGILFVIL
jgi:hypothetical protein